MTARVESGSSTARAAPSTAPAAWLDEALQMELKPYNPPAIESFEYQVTKRSGGISAENDTVETMYLGTPKVCESHTDTDCVAI